MGARGRRQVHPRLRPPRRCGPGLRAPLPQAPPPRGKLRGAAHAPAGAGPGPSWGVLRGPGAGAGLVKSRGSSPPRRSPGEASGAASGVPKREPSRSALLGGPPEACAGGAGPASACSPRRSTPSPGPAGSCGEAGESASNTKARSAALAAGPGASSAAVSLLSAGNAAASSSDGSLSPPSSAGAGGISLTKLLSRTGSESLSSEKKRPAEAAARQGLRRPGTPSAGARAACPRRLPCQSSVWRKWLVSVLLPVCGDSGSVGSVSGDPVSASY